jgi:4-hydroxy-2-oxoheptanedioate aldolase
VEGVDGVFIGPGDLSAGLGYLGQTGHPEVRRIIEDAVRSIRKAGKAPGVLTAIEEEARAYMEAGCLFTAVGSDSGLLARGSEKIARAFKS